MLLDNPLLKYELVRAARSPRLNALRAGYALVLLLTLFLVYLSYGRGTPSERALATLGGGAAIDPNERARFAETFFYSFMLVQFVVVAVVTPALVGGQIATEWRNGTFDLQRTTELSDGQIIFGKLGAQLAHLFLLLLTGLPVLSILQFLGGVDPELVFITFVGLLLALVSTGAVSLASALSTPGGQDCMKVTYGLALAYGATELVPLVGLLAALGTGHVPMLVLLAMSTGYHVFITWGALFWAFRTLRPRPRFYRRVAPPLRARRRASKGRSVPRFRRPWGRRPPLGDRDPLLWKELHYEEGATTALFTAQRGKDYSWAAAAGLSFLIVAPFLAISSVMSPVDFAHGLAVYAGVPLFLVVLILMATQAAVAITREREAGTYESLLTTPLTEAAILRAKWLGCVWHMRVWLVVLAVIFLLAVCCGGISPWAFPLVVLAAVVHVAFAINLGLYCSVASSTTVRAVTTVVGWLLAIAAGHWLIAGVALPLVSGWLGLGAAQAEYDVHLWGLTLPCNLAAFCFRDGDLATDGFVGQRLLPGLAGLVYYGGLALLLGWGVHRRMSRFRVA